MSSYVCVYEWEGVCVCVCVYEYVRVGMRVTVRPQRGEQTGEEAGGRVRVGAGGHHAAREQRGVRARHALRRTLRPAELVEVADTVLQRNRHHTLLTFHNTSIEKNTQIHLQIAFAIISLKCLPGQGTKGMWFTSSIKQIYPPKNPKSTLHGVLLGRNRKQLLNCF